MTNQSDLVEKVAEAIWDKSGRSPIPLSAQAQATKDHYTGLARAAMAVTIEACAGVCEYMISDHSRELPKFRTDDTKDIIRHHSFLIGMSALSGATQAIRSLMETGE